MPKNHALCDLTGRTFGRLTVVRRVPNPKDRQVLWLCSCACGGETVVRSHLLRRGHTDNCGCLKSQRISAKKTRHGHSNSADGPTPEYRAWAAMVRRCTNPKATNYPHYGGRGVTVCGEWRESFPAFLAHIGPAPAGGGPWTVDRIDTHGHYAPGNVRWADRATQAGNKRNSRLIAHSGLTLCVAAWSRRTGVPSGTIISRLNRGASPEQALAPADNT